MRCCPISRLLRLGLPTPPSGSFQYATVGDPGPFTVALYRSADGIPDPSDELLRGGIGGVLDNYTVVPSQPNAQGTETIILLDEYVTDPVRPYLLVVADPPDAAFPDGHVLESKETFENNIASWT